MTAPRGWQRGRGRPGRGPAAPLCPSPPLSLPAGGAERDSRPRDSPTRGSPQLLPGTAAIGAGRSRGSKGFQQPRGQPAGPGLTGPGAKHCHCSSAGGAGGGGVGGCTPERAMPTPEADPKTAAGRRGSRPGATGAALRGPRAGRWLPPGAAHSYTVSQGGGAAGCVVPRPRALAAPRRDSRRRTRLGSRLPFACLGCEWRARPAGPWHGGGVSAP